MIYTILGGSGSGKSEYAENLVLELAEKMNSCEKYYVATMKSYGEEAQKRIHRHQAMRAAKGFVTIECYEHLENVIEELHRQEKNPIVLLECMSNLTANILFSRDRKQENIENMARDIVDKLQQIAKQCCHLVVVSNDIFRDGIPYDTEITRYNTFLAMVNAELAKCSDEIAEVVYSQPVILKTLQKREGKGE